MSRFIPVSLAFAAAAVAGCAPDAPLAPDPAPVVAPEAAGLFDHGLAAGPGATVIQRAELRVDPPAGPFTLIHAMLDFQPATYFPPHVHGGPVIYTDLPPALVLLGLLRAHASTAMSSTASPLGPRTKL